MTATTSEWSLKRLKDITSKIGSGATPRGGKNGYKAEGISLIRSQNVYDFSFAEENLAFIDEEQAAELNNVTVNKNDILLNITGASVARCCLVPQRFIPARVNQHVAIVRVRPQIADAKFVLYCINSLHFKSRLLALAQGGATREALTKTTIEDFEVPQPSLPVQRQIADILSAYDELIENNQRRIRILEDMARSLYREWFVHFRYPGHESVSLVDSPLGQIPQGWEVGALGDFVQFKSGFAFKSGSFAADGEYRLVTIKNVQDGSFNPESDSLMGELPDKLPPHCVLHDGDILLSLTGNVGRVCLVYDGPFYLNQRVAKLVPNDAKNWAMTYCMFRDPEMRVKLELLSNGVAQQNLSPVLAAKMEFVQPPKMLCDRFSDLAEPMIQSVVQLYASNKNLRRTRDLLLPRLLSGQLNLATDTTPITA